MVISLFEISADIIQNGQIDVVRAVQEINVIEGLLRDIIAAAVGYNALYQAVIGAATVLLTVFFTWYAVNTILKHYTAEQQKRQDSQNASVNSRLDAIERFCEAASKKKVKA